MMHIQADAFVAGSVLEGRTLANRGKLCIMMGKSVKQYNTAL